MQVQEIVWKGLTPPFNAVSLKNTPGIGWGTLTQLPSSITLFGKRMGIYQMNQDGMLRFTDTLTTHDKTVPSDISDIMSDQLLIPWGTEQRVNACGCDVLFYQSGNRLVWDYKTKNRYNVKESFSYQVQIPINEPNIVEFHYYHCVSGYNTFVGIVNKAKKDYITWPLKEVQPYMKKALRFDTNPVIVETPKPEPTLPGSKWILVYFDPTTKLYKL